MLTMVWLSLNEDSAPGQQWTPSGPYGENRERRKRRKGVGREGRRVRGREEEEEEERVRCVFKGEPGVVS